MEIDALTKALKERDRRQGGSLAELKADLEKRKREFDEAREAVGSLRQLCRVNFVSVPQPKWCEISPDKR